MKTRELMSCKVATCAPSESLAKAAQTMWERDIGMLVVIDAQSQPVGVITDRDICMAAYTRGCTLQQANVASLLGRSVLAIVNTPRSLARHTSKRSRVA